MMKTMFGFFAADAGAASASAAVMPTSAWASSKSLANPSEQHKGFLPSWSFALAFPSACRVAGVDASALDEGLRSLLAATKPSIVPSPTHASA